MIELRRVCRNYGPFQALSDVSFAVPDHGVLGLLGVNGAGKTTALNVMTGYLPPTSGEVLVDGRSLLREPRACKRRIGYLPEVPPLYDEMTVTDFLAFVCRLREVVGRAIPDHVREIIALCGLSEVAGKPIGKLSKGYRQRVGIASALCGDPATIVLDEPTVGLDPRQVVETRELIAELGKTHAVIFSSHQLSEVLKLCGRVVILHQGRVVREAKLDELSGEGGQRLRLRAMGSPERLIPALRGVEGVRRLRPIPSGDENVTACEIECARGEQNVQARIFHLLASLDAPILLLMPGEDSLEQAFLRLTAGENG